MRGMHRRWLLVFLVASLLCAAANGCQQAQPKSEPPPPDVRYEAPITRVVKDYEDLPGRTDAIVKVQVRSRVSGYMTNSYFKDGTYVEKDAKLFEIDPRPFMADRDRAKGTVDQLDAHLRRLERSYNRAKNLLSRGSVSPEEYDQYEADYKETAAQLEVAKANLHLAELNMEWTEVRAPCAGLLSRRMTDPGNLVKADDTILTSIVSLDPLYVYFDPADSTMLKIRRLVQQRRARNESEHDVPVRIYLADEDEKKDAPHEGTIDFTDNQVDVNTGTLQFRARLRNVDHFIAPGLFVRVRLPIGDDHPAVMIREQALERDQDRKKVWLLGYDLQWMAPVKDASAIPATGKNLFVVADVNNVLHFRCFDSAGRPVVDTNEKRLTAKAQQIDDLRKQRKDLGPGRELPGKKMIELSGIEKIRFVTAVASIVGRPAFLKRKDTTPNAASPHAASPIDAIANCIAVPRYVNAGVARDGYLEIKEGIEPDDLVVIEGMQKLIPGIVVKYEPAKPDLLAAPGSGPPQAKAGPVAAALQPANNANSALVSAPPSSVRENAARLPQPGGQIGPVRRRDEIPSSSPAPAGASSTHPAQPSSLGPRASH